MAEKRTHGAPRRRPTRAGAPARNGHARPHLEGQTTPPRRRAASRTTAQFRRASPARLSSAPSIARPGVIMESSTATPAHDVVTAEAPTPPDAPTPKHPLRRRRPSGASSSPAFSALPLRWDACSCRSCTSSPPSRPLHRWLRGGNRANPGLRGRVDHRVPPSGAPSQGSIGLAATVFVNLAGRSELPTWFPSSGTLAGILVGVWLYGTVVSGIGVTVSTTSDAKDKRRSHHARGWGTTVPRPLRHA